MLKYAYSTRLFKNLLFLHYFVKSAISYKHRHEMQKREKYVISNTPQKMQPEDGEIQAGLHVDNAENRIDK